MLIIDGLTRTITVPAEDKLFGVTSDEKTQVKHLQCPRYTGNGVDLSTFSLRINYINAGNETDQYLVKDMKVNGDMIEFSWELSRHVTMYKGTVRFIICAVRVDDKGLIQNEWNTTYAVGEVLQGIEVDGSGYEEETSDAIEGLLLKVNERINALLETLPEDFTEVEKKITDINKDLSNLEKKESFFRGRNGKNFFDPSDVVTGFTINSAGELAESGNNAQSTRNFMPIDGGEKYTISVNGALSSLLVVAFYDATKTFISRVTSVTSFTTPDNCKYIRVSDNHGREGQIVGFLGKNQIEKGSTVTPYEEYSTLANMTVDWGMVKNVEISADDIPETIKKLLTKEEIAGVVKKGFYGGMSNSWVDSTAITTIEYNPQEGDVLFYSGKVYGSANYGYIIFWNADGNVIDVVGRSTSTAVVYKDTLIRVPKNTAMVSVSGFTNDGSELSLKKYVAKNKTPLRQFAGHCNIPDFDTDYAHVISYGQSLSDGSDSLYVQDKPVDGVYMLGDSITNPSAVLNQVTATQQHPIISAVNSLATLVRENYKNDAEFICGSYGVGGQSIAQLMSTARQAEIKAEDGYEYNIDTNGRYQTFLNSLTFAKQVADAKNKSISCPAIVFMQGERDYYSDETLPSQPGSKVHAYACGGDKDKYKLYMKRLKEDMQNAVMTTYGQRVKPLFFIYEVSGAFVKNYRMTINQAQIEFAEENDDVVLLPAPYFTPNYNSGHLATNGYRWFGEYIAKAIFEKIVRGSETNYLKPCGFYVEEKNVHLKIDGVVGGLTIDTYTVEEAIDKGFDMILNESTYVSHVTPKVYGDEIIIEAPVDISGDNYTSIELLYAGQRVGGTGNIRDNSKYTPMYEYWNDTNDKGSSGNLTISHRPTDKNGNSMIGEKYPMYKWLIPFYIKLR